MREGHRDSHSTFLVVLDESRVAPVRVERHQVALTKLVVSFKTKEFIDFIWIEELALNTEHRVIGVEVKQASVVDSLDENFLAAVALVHHECLLDKLILVVCQANLVLNQQWVPFSDGFEGLETRN